MATTGQTRVHITHADRVLFGTASAAAPVAKGELVDYYAAIAPVMLRHLRGRPLTVQRFPRGIGEPGFFQQDFAKSLPEWMTSAAVTKEGGGTVVHALAESRDALVWLANQDCLTLHAWQGRRPQLDRPDRLVFDLDPSGDDFATVKATARATADVLDTLGLVPYVQTTGSRGLHVVVPLRRASTTGTDFDTARKFARDVAAVVVADDPRHRTIEMRKDNRGGRVYLDVLRNAYGQTAVAPYAVRARPGAPVATPLEWDELDEPGLRPDQFTIGDLSSRLAAQRDPWQTLNRHARTLTGPIQRLHRRYA